MAIPLAVPVVGALVVGTGTVLALRAKKAKALAAAATGGSTPASPAAIAAANAAVRAAGVPAIPPPVKNADGTISPSELARSLEAEKLRASQLTDAQLKAIDAAAVVNGTVAPFDPNSGGGTPFPAGTFKAGDIIPSDRVTVNIVKAGLQGLGIAGDVLIRETQFNTDTTVTGVIIDPRVNDGGQERQFPLDAVTGVGPVSF